MKNIFLTLSLFLSANLFSQGNPSGGPKGNIFNPKTKNQVQKIWIGPNIATFATNSFDGGLPFEYGSNLALTVGVARKKTFHNLLYLTRNNTIRVLSGWLTKWGDVYVYGTKSLNTNAKHAGIGMEKLIKVNENVKLFPYIEIGLDFNGGQSFTVGVVMPIQLTIWKRK